MMASTALSIILPAKNEIGAVGDTVRRIRLAFPDAEVLVVNDGSTDDTAGVAEAAGARVITHPYSMGNGAAIKTGARQATGEVLVFMDADGQHDPADIPRLLARLNDGLDMVVGARQSGSQASVGRGLANRFYNALASWMTGQKIEDLTSGFRAVRADKFREFLYLLPNGFSYPTTCTMAFFRAGYGVAYVPIMAAQRIGKSHIRLVKDGIRFLLIIFKIGTLYSPLKLFLPVSLLHFIVGLSYYLYTYSEFNRLSLASVFLWSAAVTIFLIGLVSEQITQLMYKDSGNRPDSRHD
ncbi:glycosyltransferase family 2 protein [Halothiobacillus neapolitanus]|uniref:Glycosyl transferase family 2 n=1 Tax=Halothiobacillus neapolitanus (strain ATCC 23641 / DSM 15147 / CIP 104769 / NCIMB 8539 / c2) TaxID=555778 RepID=D0KWW7_HALNC|nr:glycosyl transferase family 2 [Halothiobacillus neapolitanus c2]TDN58043.1 glycosyltransferase involved in cell wall biosynthesis [Halothiobacillus neapolitanus]